MTGSRRTRRVLAGALVVLGLSSAAIGKWVFLASDAGPPEGPDQTPLLLVAGFLMMLVAIAAVVVAILLLMTSWRGGGRAGGE